MIYQELALAPDLSVEANIMLGQERVRAGFIRRREHRRVVRQVLDLLEHPDIRPDARVKDLGVGAQQLVEVARALVSSAQVIVFDEPTSTLTEHDADRLFVIIERLRSAGWRSSISAIFWRRSGELPRPTRCCATAGRLRQARLAETEIKTIIAHMVGRDLEELFPHVPHTPGESILELKGLKAGKHGKPANLSLRRGEILGIAGLVGAGRTTLLRAIFGLGPVVVGTHPGRARHRRAGAAGGPDQAGTRVSERGPQGRGAGT